MKTVVVAGRCTYRMVGTELEGVRRKNSDGKEPQEHETAHSRVLNVWVSCREKQRANN